MFLTEVLLTIARIAFYKIDTCNDHKSELFEMKEKSLARKTRLNLSQGILEMSSNKTFVEVESFYDEQ